MDTDDRLDMMVKFCRENGLIGMEIDGIRIDFHPDSIEPAGRNYADPVEAAAKCREAKINAPIALEKKIHKFKRKK